MAYTGYEASSGAAMDGVEALCKAYTSSGAFTTATQPTLAEVEQWLTEGYRMINVALMEYGYDADQTDADVKGALQRYNVLYAAAQVEYSQASAGFTEGSSGRGDMFMRQYEGRESGNGKRLVGGIGELIQSVGFSRLGATKAEELTGLLSTGGISKSDKLTIEQDSDHVGYAFTRTRFDNKGAWGGYQDTRADL